MTIRGGIRQFVASRFRRRYPPIAAGSTFKVGPARVEEVSICSAWPAVARGCWPGGSVCRGAGGREGGKERSSKELPARNNGKSSVYLMARNHAILSSTVGLLPRCRPTLGADSALILAPNSPTHSRRRN